MRGGAEARDPQGRAGRRARRAGRARATSCSCCSTACCASRSTASALAELGPGAVARRAGAARGRAAHVDAARRVHAVQGRGRPRPTRSTRRPGRAAARATARGGADPGLTSRRRRVCGSTSAASAARPRPRARSSPATAGTRPASRSPHDGEPAAAGARRRHGPAGRSTALLGGAPSRARILLGHLHWDHTQGLPFFAAGDHPDAAGRPARCPSDRGDAGRRRCSRGPCRRRTSRSRPTELRGARGASSASSRRRSTLEGFEVLAREIPHKGGRTFGYRVSDGRHLVRLPVRPRPGRARARARRARRRTTRPRWRSPPASTCWSTTPSTPPRSSPRAAHFGHSAADYAVALGVAAGAGRVLAVPPRPGPDRRRARRHRRPLRRRRPSR